MEQPLEVKVAQGPRGFTELFLTGVSLRELAYIFRSRFAQGYLLALEVDTGSVLGSSLAETLAGDGVLCEELEEDGDALLLRADSFDLLAELKPFRMKLLFCSGPLSAEDFRRAGGVRELYPDHVDRLLELRGQLWLSWRADQCLMLAGRDGWFPRDVLEYFFEKSFLDNERMLRSDELDSLLQTLLPPISLTGLHVHRALELSASEPVRAIGWTEPDFPGAASVRFDAEVPCWSVRRSSGGIEVALDGKVRLYRFLGAGSWLKAFGRRLRAALALPLLLASVMLLVHVASLPEEDQSGTGVGLLLLLLLLANLAVTRR